MSRSAAPAPQIPRPARAVTGLWPTVLAALLRGENLPAPLTEQVMDEIVSDTATPAQIAAFAVLLRAKGETADEIAGLVTSLMRNAAPVRLEGAAVDIVGTGGDGADTANRPREGPAAGAGVRRPRRHRPGRAW
jgi:anthranilate phosphoribosyltransferase